MVYTFCAPFQHLGFAVTTPCLHLGYTLPTCLFTLFAFGVCRVYTCGHLVITSPSPCLHVVHTLYTTCLHVSRFLCNISAPCLHIDRTLSAQCARIVHSVCTLCYLVFTLVPPCAHIAGTLVCLVHGMRTSCVRLVDAFSACVRLTEVLPTCVGCFVELVVPGRCAWPRCPNLVAD